MYKMFDSFNFIMKILGIGKEFHMKNINSTNYWSHNRMDYDNSRVAQSYFGKKISGRCNVTSECESGCSTCATSSCATGCTSDD